MPRKKKKAILKTVGFFMFASSLYLVSAGFAANPPAAALKNKLLPACLSKVSPEPGNCAPHFRANTLAGAPWEPTELRGKVILLHFWATWCEPCRDELPTLKALQQIFQGKALAIVTVSLDTQPQAVFKFFADQLPAFTMLLDAQQKLSGDWGTFKVPESFIIGCDGKVHDKVQGSRDWTDGITVHYLENLSRDCALGK